MNLFFLRIRATWQLLAVIFVFGVSSVSAQSQSELEMAKMYAKQMGYSDSEINEMMGAATGGMNSTSDASNRSTSSRTNMNELSTLQSVDGVTMDGMGMGMSEDMIQFREETLLKVKALAKADSINIYGHKLLLNGSLFKPNKSIATPENYILSAGDEVIIDLWGDVFSNIIMEITPEGNIVIENVGPISLSGLNIKEAEKRIKQRLSRIYAGLSLRRPTTYLQLSLGNIRSISINILGDVNSPGTYTLTSLSTMFSAIYMANGIDTIGTLRAIELVRNGKIIHEFDLYKLLNSTEEGVTGEIRLEDNDLIRVGTYKNLVKIEGAIKRPMRYEMKDGESLSDLLNYAGGFISNARRSNIFVKRNYLSPIRTYSVGASEMKSFALMDGDIIIIESNLDKIENDVYVSGALWNPGRYSISDTLNTVRELISNAGGLLDEAFLDRATIMRVDSVGIFVAESFPLRDLLSGSINDINLMRGDSLFIYSIPEITELSTVKIEGEINKPGKFDYREGLTLGDMILMSGGLTNAATLARIEIARRIPNTNNMLSSEKIATISYLNLVKNPIAVDTKLHPYDIIYVRRTPDFKPQVTIAINGEVNFPGEHAMEKSTIRLSDIISKVNGFTKDAHILSAKLSRKLSEEELERLMLAIEIARSRVIDNRDNIALDSMKLGERYNIAIDLQKAVNNPGSYADVVLKTGDIITVPQLNNTVKISGGGITFPNVVTYDPDMSVKDYIGMAGGYSELARKRNVYIVHMNGEVASKKSSKGQFKPRPGSEIIVPIEDEKGKMSTMEIITVATASTTSIATLATMVMSALNSFK